MYSEEGAPIIMLHCIHHTPTHTTHYDTHKSNRLPMLFILCFFCLRSFTTFPWPGIPAGSGPRWCSPWLTRRTSIEQP